MPEPRSYSKIRNRLCVTTHGKKDSPLQQAIGQSEVETGGIDEPDWSDDLKKRRRWGSAAGEFSTNFDNEALSATRLSRINQSEVDHVDLEFAVRAGFGPRGQGGSQCPFFTICPPKKKPVCAVVRSNGSSLNPR